MYDKTTLVLPALGAVLYVLALAQLVYVPWLASRWKRGGCLWFAGVVVLDLAWFVLGPVFGFYGLGLATLGVSAGSWFWVIGNACALLPTLVLWMIGPSPSLRRRKSVSLRRAWRK